MKKYTIQPGQQNFTPIDNAWPKFNLKRFTVRAILHPSCYYSLADWESDRDWFDWNKLKGITEFFSANNSRSCMVAWRPGVKAGFFQVAAYVNYPKTQVETKLLGTVPAGALFEVKVEMHGGQAVFAFRCGADSRDVSMRYRRAWVSREVGTWIGGANNEDGPYGGEASQRMELEAEITY